MRCILNYLKLLNCWCNCHKAIFQLEHLPREGMNTLHQTPAPRTSEVATWRGLSLVQASNPAPLAAMGHYPDFSDPGQHLRQRPCAMTAAIALSKDVACSYNQQKKGEWTPAVINPGLLGPRGTNSQRCSYGVRAGYKGRGRQGRSQSLSE